VIVPNKRTSGQRDFTGSAIDPQQIESRLAQTGATIGGELEISLAWNSMSDLDIQVVAPSGEQVDAKNAYARCGGVQDVDANPTPLTDVGSLRAERGQIPGAENIMPLRDHTLGGALEGQLGDIERMLGKAMNRAPSHYSRTPVEHIYFERATKGEYKVLVNCFCWREPSKMPLPFTIQVRSRGRVVQTVAETIGPSSFCVEGTGSMEICRFTVQ
jgi:hypothetical protein